MHFLRAALPALALLALAPRAGASDDDAVRTAERLDRKAMEDYDNLEFDSAKQTLNGALEKLRVAGRDETPAAARIHLSLGMVYFAADKDRSRALNQLVEALKLDPAAQLDPERATPELQELFGEAQKRVNKGARRRPEAPPPRPPSLPPRPPPGPAPARPAPVPSPAAPVTGLQHEPIDEARAGEDVTVRAQLGDDVAAIRMFVFYRSGGQEQYTSLPMAKAGADWVAAIPGSAVGGKFVQYYLEARDKRGRPAIASGSAVSPHIISVVNPSPDSERPPGLGGRPVSAHPPAIERKPPAAKGPARGYGRMFVNVMIGTGIGLEFAGNRYEVAYLNDPMRSPRFQPLLVRQSGLASAPLHGALEVGVNVNRRIALSLMARLQGTLINNADSSDAAAMPLGGGTSKATAAAAGLLRLRYRFLEGRLRPAIHVDAGGGQIRHALEITGAGSASAPLVDQTTADFYRDPAKPVVETGINRVCLDRNPCYDNVAIGFLLAGAGASLEYDLTTFRNGGLGLLVDLTALAGFGDQLGLNLDVQLGFAAHFL